MRLPPDGPHARGKMRFRLRDGRCLPRSPPPAGSAYFNRVQVCDLHSRPPAMQPASFMLPPLTEALPL